MVLALERELNVTKSWAVRDHKRNFEVLVSSLDLLKHVHGEHAILSECHFGCQRVRLSSEQRFATHLQHTTYYVRVRVQHICVPFWSICCWVVLAKPAWSSTFVIRILALVHISP